MDRWSVVLLGAVCLLSMIIVVSGVPDVCIQNIVLEVSTGVSVCVYSV